MLLSLRQETIHLTNDSTPSPRVCTATPRIYLGLQAWSQVHTHTGTHPVHTSRGGCGLRLGRGCQGKELAEGKMKPHLMGGSPGPAPVSFHASS